MVRVMLAHLRRKQSCYVKLSGDNTDHSHPPGLKELYAKFISPAKRAKTFIECPFPAFRLDEHDDDSDAVEDEEALVVWKSVVEDPLPGNY